MEVNARRSVLSTKTPKSPQNLVGHEGHFHGQHNRGHPSRPGPFLDVYVTPQATPEWQTSGSLERAQGCCSRW